MWWHQDGGAFNLKGEGTLLYLDQTQTMRHFATNGAVIRCESMVIGTYATNFWAEGNHAVFGGVLMADTIDFSLVKFEQSAASAADIDVADNSNMFIGDGVVLQRNTAITGSCFAAALAAPLTIGGDILVRNHSATQGTIYIDRLATASIRGVRSHNNRALTGGTFVQFEPWASGLVADSESNGDVVTSGVGIAHVGDRAAVDFANIRIVNASVSWDGVVYAATSKLLSVRSSVITGCFAGVGGSAIYAKDTTRLVLDNSTVTDNVALLWGAIYIDNTVAHIAGLVAANNVAGAAAAVYAHSGARVSIAGSEFVRNTANSGSAGAIHIGLGAVANFENMTLRANYAREMGGAIAMEGGSELTAYGTLMIGNDATYGGAMSLAEASLFRSNGNCGFVENAADQDGGVVYVGCDSATLFDQASDFFEKNWAANAGGVAFFDHRCTATPVLPATSTNNAGYGSITASGIARIDVLHEDVEETSGEPLKRPIILTVRDALGQLCETADTSDALSLWLTLNENAANASLNGGVARVELDLKQGVAISKPGSSGLILEGAPGTSIGVMAKLAEISNRRGSYTHQANLSVTLRQCRVGEILTNEGSACLVCSDSDAFNLFPLRRDMSRTSCAACPKHSSCAESVENATGHSIKPRSGCASTASNFLMNICVLSTGTGAARGSR